MSRILELLKYINMPEDKANHFITGLYIFLLFGVFIHPIVGLSAAIVAGILKEIYDKLSGKGTPDIWDAVATAGGGLLGFVCSLI